MARSRRPLPRALRVEGRDDRGDGARRQGERRAAQQRGHGPARGGRRPGGDGVRERAALSPAAAQGRRARSREALQREHHRVARRRPAGRLARRPRASLEPGARADLRHRAGAGGRAASRRAVRCGASCHRSAPHAASRPPKKWRSIERPCPRDTPTGARELLVNVASAPLPDRRGRERRDDRPARGHHVARAARGAAADLGEDGLDRPARRRRRARGEHAAHRHLELHADAARRRGSGRSPHEAAREDRAADVPGGQNRQRPAQPRAAGQGGAGAGRSARRHQRRAVAARAPVPDQQRPGAEGSRRGGADRPGHRAQAAAGVPQPVPERARCDAEGRVAVDLDAGRDRADRRGGRRHRRRHPGRAPLAYLRSVLHDQADRPGHGTRAVHHLRHRPRPRRAHHVRQRWQGDGVQADPPGSREPTRAGSSPEPDTGNAGGGKQEVWWGS